VAGIGFVPWLPTFLDETHAAGSTVIGFLNPFDLHAIGVGVGHWSIGHPFIPITSLPGRWAIAMILTGLAAASLGISLTMLRARRTHEQLAVSAETLLVVVLAAAAPVEVAAYSLIGNSVAEAR